MGLSYVFMPMYVAGQNPAECWPIAIVCKSLNV